MLSEETVKFIEALQWKYDLSWDAKIDDTKVKTRNKNYKYYKL